MALGRVPSINAPFTLIGDNGAVMSKVALALTAIIAGLAAPGASAWAQGVCLQCDLPPGERGNGNDGNNGNGPMDLSVTSDINFGRIVVINTGNGQILMDPVTGAKVASGELQDLGGMAFSGHAVVSGKPFRSVRIEFPSSVTLSGGTGTTAQLTNLTTNLPAFPLIGSDGTLAFDFSGTLNTNSPGGGNLRGSFRIRVFYN